MSAVHIASFTSFGLSHIIVVIVLGSVRSLLFRESFMSAKLVLVGYGSELREQKHIARKKIEQLVRVLKC